MAHLRLWDMHLMVQRLVILLKVIIRFIRSRDVNDFSNQFKKTEENELIWQYSIRMLLWIKELIIVLISLKI
jgi:hypothetical protein